MIRFFKFTFAFLALNYFSGQINIKAMMNRAVDVGLTINHVSKDGSISQEDKDAIVQELTELSEAIFKLLDDIQFPK